MGDMEEPEIITVPKSDITVERSFSTDDEKRAEETKREIRKCLVEIRQGENHLQVNYVRLGVALLEARSKKFWLLWGFGSFGAFIKKMEEVVGRRRSQLYNTISTVEKLLPCVGQDQLVDMGISRAAVLKKACDEYGRVPDDLVVKALDRDLPFSEFKSEVASKTRAGVEPENTDWFEISGFHCTPEERGELKRAFHCAKVAGPVSNKLPQWAQDKAVMLLFSREFLATYEHEVSKGFHEV